MMYAFFVGKVLNYDVWDFIFFIKLKTAINIEFSSFEIYINKLIQTNDSIVLISQ